MKKLIALAVAAAAAPAMAAISLSGGVEVSYTNQDAGNAVSVAGSTAAAVAESKTVGTEQATLSVSASSELDNGMTISTSYTLHSAGNAVTNDGGEGSIKIAGSFGSLSVGDVAGPLDSRDGQAAATAENDLSAAFGGDMSVVYTLPNMVEGLNISAGMGAKNGGDAGVADDAQGVAFDYTVAGFKIYAGVEESKTAVAAVDGVDAVEGIWVSGATYSAVGSLSAAIFTRSATVATAGSYDVLQEATAAVAASAADTKENEVTAYGASYSINGFTVAANFAEKEVKTVSTGTIVKYEKQAYGVAYNTGNLTVAFNSLEDETDGVKVEETDTVSASYSLGGGASVYAAQTSRDIGKNDESTVGIKFSF